MNLWETLGITPAAGVGIAIAGFVAAALYANRLFRVGRKPQRIRIDLG